MGNSSSKAASRAASAATRSYPSATAPSNNGSSSSSQPPVQPAAQVHPPTTTHPSTDHKSQMIELDARDPHFASSLSRAGRAQRVTQAAPPSSQQPQPQSSFPTSSRPPHLQQAPTGQNIFPPSASSQNAATSTNPALQIVAARQRITRQWAAEQEGMGRKGFEGRTLLAARELREAFNMRQAGIEEEEVERTMRLKRGTLATLPVGVVRNVS